MIVIWSSTCRLRKPERWERYLWFAFAAYNLQFVRCLGSIFETNCIHNSISAPPAHAMILLMILSEKSMHVNLNRGFSVHCLEPNTKFVEDQTAHAPLSGNKGKTSWTFWDKLDLASLITHLSLDSVKIKMPGLSFINAINNRELENCDQSHQSDSINQSHTVTLSFKKGLLSSHTPFTLYRPSCCFSLSIWWIFSQYLMLCHCILHTTEVCLCFSKSHLSKPLEWSRLHNTSQASELKYKPWLNHW